MSIEKMISPHPDVGKDFNQPLAQAARHAMLGPLFCTACADACVADYDDMRQCIRSRLDCADVCDATAHLAADRRAALARID